MKKINFCLAAFALSLLLSGCGMARDGFIGEMPETREPIESPYITSTPVPTDRPTDTHMTDGNDTEEMPASDKNADKETGK